jgi:hypothetical protein
MEPVGARSTDDLEAASIQTLTTAQLETALSDGAIATVHDALCARLALAANG